MLTVRQNGLTSDTEKTLFTDISLALAAGKQVFLLVPEQQTLVAEREAVDVLPPSATLRFEVTNFTRLANTVFRTLGGVAAHYADATSKAVLVWRALSEAAPFLSLDMAKPNVANVTKALSAIGEMQSLGMDAEKLKLAAEDPAVLSSPKLKNKLSDLSYIMSCYEAVLGETFADSSSDTEEMTKRLCAHPEVFKDAAFFFDGFTSFTEPQLSLLSVLMARADVTVSIILPKSDEDGFIYAETRKTKDTLLRLGDLCSVPKRCIREESFNRLSDVGFDRIARHLWHFSPAVDNFDCQNTKQHVRIFEADSPYEEAAFITSDIERAVMGGAKYSDFAVIAHDESSLDGILKASFQASGIPVFLSQKRPVCAFEPFHAISAAYRAILFGFSPDDVFTYAKCGYTQASADEISELEIYVQRYKIKGEFFAYSGAWGMNPLGYSDRVPENLSLILSRINKARHDVIDPLLLLLEDTTAAKTVKEHATALFRFLTEIDMEGNLLRRTDSLLSGSDPAGTDGARLYAILLSTLDSLVDTAGEVKIDGKQFSELLTIAFSAADIGRIPAAFDEVTFGIADTLRVAGKKYVYLLDVNQGVFPANAKDNSHFSDKEKLLLSKLGLPTSQNEDLRVARERFCFSRAFVCGSDGVTLITTKRNNALKSQNPADILTKIKEMTNGVIQITPIANLSCSESVYSPLYAVTRLSEEKNGVAIREALLDTAYGEQMKMARHIQNRNLTLKEETAHTLYPDKMTLSDSRLSQYADCPFSHFCRYVLQLDEQKSAEVGALHIGNMIHEVLERYLKEVCSNLEKDGTENADKADFEPFSPVERKQKITEIANDICRRLFSADTRHSLQKEHFLKRLTDSADRLAESVTRELSRPENRFVPVDFELRIAGAEGAVDPFIVRDGTKQTRIIGKVDRVDAFTEGKNVFVRVMDYKTGTKMFTPADLEKGTNLQMFLYLRAITESPAFAARFPGAERIIPAGVFYVPVSPGGLKASTPSEARKILSENKAEYKGMVLSDPDVLSSVQSDYFPIHFKADQTPDRRSQSKLFTEEGWQELSKTVETRVKATSNDLRDGKIPASPMKKGSTAACEYCSFRAVCRSVI